MALLTLIITLLSTISGCIQQEKTSENNNTNNTFSINENSTIYVGSAHTDYNTIQEAINAAKNGATIIIKNGSYNELIIINKTITLIGEDKNTTIINFNQNYEINRGPIIQINADNCSIENVQITVSNNSVIAQGISINSNNNTIKNNIITEFEHGIELLRFTASNKILYNEIRNNTIGIYTIGSTTNNISNNNIFSNTQYNIYLTTNSHKNNISFNIMSNSHYGIRIQGSQYNNVYKNYVHNNQIGLYPCCGTNLNYFYNNTLVNNSQNAQEKSGVINVWYDNQTGIGNYYDDYAGSDENHDGIGDTPYEIPGAGNKDIYPLMTPPIDAPCNQ